MIQVDKGSGRDVYRIFGEHSGSPSNQGQNEEQSGEASSPLECCKQIHSSGSFRKMVFKYGIGCGVELLLPHLNACHPSNQPIGLSKASLSSFISMWYSQLSHRERFSSTVALTLPCPGLQLWSTHDSRVWKRPCALQLEGEESEYAQTMKLMALVIQRLEESASEVPF